MEVQKLKSFSVNQVYNFLYIAKQITLYANTIVLEYKAGSGSQVIDKHKASGGMQRSSARLGPEQQ